jgi:UDP-2-acetamido-3-amino-2,3-dideoxy-glucuronate N-acetyltransferase
VHPSAFVHPSALVEERAMVGARTSIWHRCHVRAGSQIGEDSNLGFSVYVDTDAVVGSRCKIQNHVSIFRGVVLEDDVFVGPSATFTNDMRPRASSTTWTVVPTLVRRGASIGANATIICGVEIGTWSMVAAGAVVTRDVPTHALVAGTPARVRGSVCECGDVLARTDEPMPAACSSCGRASPELGR